MIIQKERNGQFAKGNSGGPGRPKAEKERKYLAALSHNCSIADWKQICIRAVKDAKDGDHRAREWLTKYLVGEPQTQVLHGHVHASVNAEANPYSTACPEALMAAMCALDQLNLSIEDERQD